MTTPSSWHPEGAALQTYATGRAEPAAASSVEAHVLTCPACRAVLARSMDHRRLVGVRGACEDRIDAATRPWTERALRRVGVGEADARVLLAAPAMRRAWWLAVILSLGLAALAAAQHDPRGVTLLVLAPLLPALSTAASYSARLDPTLSLTAATPYSALRLLLLRSGVVAGGATALAVAASAALPYGAAEAGRWLLPAAALTVAVLALSRWVEAGVAAALCCSGWLTAVWLAGREQQDLLMVYERQGQGASAVVLVVALVLVVRYRDRLDLGSLK